MKDFESINYRYPKKEKTAVSLPTFATKSEDFHVLFGLFVLIA